MYASLRTMARNSLGELIRETRVARGFKLRPFAKLLRISPTHLSDVEHERRVPSEEVLGDIARELDLDFDVLMNLAGRLGEKTERYAQSRPEAATLFRKLSKKNVGRSVLKGLDAELERLTGKGKRRS